MTDTLVKSNKGQAHQRRSQILVRLKTHETITTADLAREYGVSIATITRDLNELEAEGMILRVHGGATRIRDGEFERPFSTREILNLEEKRQIAACALDFVQEGDSLILDVGTTVFEFARLLKKKTNITVIATSLTVAQELASQPGIQLIIVGGKFRRSEYSMIGHLAEMNLRNFSVDKAFLSAAGISVEQGVTEYSYDQAGLKKVIVEQAKKRVLLADHTKFEKSRLALVTPLSNIDTIISDPGLDHRVAEKYRLMGLTVAIAGGPVQPDV